MHRTARFSSRLLFGACIVCFAVLSFAQDPSSQDELKWRAEHTAKLQRPDGWLSLTGLEWLASGDNSIGAAADSKIRLAEGNAPHVSILRLTNGDITLVPPPEGFPKGLLVAGSPAKEGALRADSDDDKFNPHLTIGTLNMYVIHRGDRFALRIKDSRSPTLVNFHGLQWYPPDTAYRVSAHWTPYTPSRTVTLATLVGTSYPQPVPGAAEFTLQGKTFRLEPVLEDPKTPELFFIMLDTTSKTTTYPASRFLYTGFPSNGLDKPGILILDFNHLENPPCAYTPYATCPLPPAGNRLSIALPVGEKRYHN